MIETAFIVDFMAHGQECEWCLFQANIQDNGVDIAGCGRADKPFGQPRKRNGGYLVSFQMSVAVMGLAGCTMLRLAVVLKSLGWSLKDVSPNPTWIQLCSRIDFVDECVWFLHDHMWLDRSGQAFIFLEEDGARLGEEMGAMKWHDSMKRLDRWWLIGWFLCVDAAVAWTGA